MYQRLTETQNHEKELRMEYSEDTKNRLTKAIKYFIKHGLFVFFGRRRKNEPEFKYKSIHK